MTSPKKTLEKVLRGTSDSHIRFDDLRNLLLDLGFEERIKGSHHIFTLKGKEAALNLQPDGEGVPGQAGPTDHHRSEAGDR